MFKNGLDIKVHNEFLLAFTYAKADLLNINLLLWHLPREPEKKNEVPISKYQV
jgi:hypothetical protein